jgi:citrate synthase
MADINTGKTAKLDIDGKVIDLPIVEGTEQERGLDISNLRSATGHITLDDGYGNTGSCQSSVTFIDGDKGILRYRGIPIEELADKSSFIETAYLLIYGHLPTKPELSRFSQLLTQEREPARGHEVPLRGLPLDGAPDGDSVVDDQRVRLLLPGLLQRAGRDEFDIHAARLISQVRTIAAFSYRKSHGLPIIYPKPTYRYTANFLHMLFSDVYQDYELRPEVVRALDLIFILHADHEQNCSTSTVRMVASAQANLFASTAAGVCALWGPLHGGANQAVIEMLTDIHNSGDNGSRFIAAAKEKGSGKKLMGFGHRVYKNYDPRARIIKKACDEPDRCAQDRRSVARHRQAHGRGRPVGCLFRRAQAVPQRGFLQRHHHARPQHPDRDVHGRRSPSAACPAGSPTSRRSRTTPSRRIYRPRQIYVGQPLNHYVPMDQRRVG